MNLIEWVLSVVGKGVLVLATVLLSLISSGSLAQWLNDLIVLLTTTGLDSTSFLLALIAFFVASMKYIPEIVAAFPSGNSTSTKAGKSWTTGIAEGMRII